MPRKKISKKVAKSFVAQYLKKSKLEKLPKKVKKNLAKAEERLSKKVAGDGTFGDIIKDHAGELVDLVDRLKENFKDWKFSVTRVFQDLRFVIGISTEVAQIVNEIEGELGLEGLTPEQARQRKVEFGQELVYFVWLAWNPFGDIAKWIPFKSTIEKRLVFWVAEMGIEAALDFFAANQEVTVSSVKKKKKIVKSKVLRKAF